MSEKVFSRCGRRCDLCLIWRPNVEKQDRREAVCAAWRKMWAGYSPDPAQVICDGCRCEKEGAVLFDPTCRVRACVLEKGLEHCGCCEQYPCGIFPAEPSEEEVRRRIEVDKLWTWEDEKLMEAYACRKHMDEFRETRQENEM